MKTLAFDVYGTLIDTAGVASALQKLLGTTSDKAADLANDWRQKQLEYTFRYACMGHYQDFRECTRQALDYCCAAQQLHLSQAARDELMAHYLQLPVFDDVLPGLRKLSRANLTMYAFSNGHPDDLQALLVQAGIRDYFAQIISVHEVASFKPDPAVYHHFLKRAATSPEQSCLVSSNAFDVCGARAIGMQAVWLRRNAALVFDPWSFTATHEITSFVELAELFID